MDFNLSDEQKLIVETAREFADREILPVVRENDRAEHFDRELARIRLLGRRGEAAEEREIEHRVEILVRAHATVERLAQEGQAQADHDAEEQAERGVEGVARDAEQPVRLDVSGGCGHRARRR